MLRPLLMGRRVFYYGDFDKFFYPVKLLVARALAEGRIPLWDSTLMGGLPVLGHPLYGALYPPSIIPALLPFHLGLGVFFAFHYLLAGLFTYYLMREWELSPAASLVAALSFSFGGVMVASANVPPVLQTMTWFPMLALCFQRAIRRGSGVYLVLSALALALMFYGGEIYLAYIGLMVFLLWAAAEMISGRRGAKHLKGRQWPPMGFIVTVLIGILLSLPILLPSGLLVSLSPRAGGLGMADAAWFSLRPGGLAGFMLPSLFFDQQTNTPWYDITGVYRTGYFLSLYAGAIPLVLSFMGIITPGRRLRWFFLALLLVSVTAAMGRELPVFALIHRYVPFMGMFRYPEKFLAFSSFFLAMFSGFGAETLLQRCRGSGPGASAPGGSVDETGESRAASGNGVGKILGWSLPWLIVVGVALAYGASRPERFMALVRLSRIFNAPLSPEPQNYSALQAALTMDLVKFSGLVVALVIFSVIAIKAKDGKLLLGPALVFLTALDLFTAHQGLNVTAPEDYYLKPPQVVRYLEGESEPYRVHSLIFEKKRGMLPLIFPDVYSIFLWEKEALKPNIGAIYGMHYAEGESALRLSKQETLNNQIRRAPHGLKEKLLGIYNVKYLLALDSQEGELARNRDDLELVKRFDMSKTLLYRNKRYLPRVYYVPAARFVGTDAQALSALKGEDFDPLKEVVITVGKPPGSPPAVRRGPHESAQDNRGDPSADTQSIEAGVSLLDYRDSLVSVGVNFSRSGYLVLSDVHYPGWSVTVDGKPAELLQANYLFRAVKLPPGTHFVRFSFTPYAFIKGLYAGPPVAGLGIILILVFYFASRRRETAPPDGAAADDSS